MPRILGVDDSAQNRSLIELYLQGTEFEVVTAPGGHEALELCRREQFDLILLDVVMPQIDGFEVCRRLKEDPRTAFVPVIFLTGRLADEASRSAAFRLGAVDYIQKPVDRDELVARIRVMLRLEQARSRLDRENTALRQDLEATRQQLQDMDHRAEDLERLREALWTAAERDATDAARLVVPDAAPLLAVEERLRGREQVPAAPHQPPRPGYAISEFVGDSPKVLELAEKVGKLRNNRSTVLIYGESGAGKELIARALHFDGRFRGAPFIPMHCGAIAPELIESELFGHEKGSFTGAQQSRVGLFEAADGGSIFLDEIAEMSLDIQVKLLRVLQRGEIRPVGASQPRLVDVRILAATNRDLLEMVKDGTFREDLYYRLEVVTLYVPPLRERMGDVPKLVEHFLQQANRRHDRADRPVRGVSNAAMQRLLDYPWPGNVRELENAIEGAFALGVGELLQEEDLPQKIVLGRPELVPRPVSRTTAPPPMSIVDDGGGADLRSLRNATERRAIESALAECSGDKLAAAAQLGMSRSTFYRRLKELGL
ncbi:MAG: hypothetical protein RL398_2822 [Planctomycetota bacterium]|jgi:DNA-binding NtrC family response regulator